MQQQIKLSIVFLNFNRIHETQFTLEHLAVLYAHRNDIEIIAVDNGSTDGTADYLRNQNTAIPVLLNENTGIAGYNHGFEQTRGQYILVLDDDSCPQSSSAIDLVIQQLDASPHIGIIACRIITPDNEDQWSWHLPPHQVRGASPFFIGCGFIIRRDLFKTIGWYPESFFLYQNEVEVCFQIGLLGYDIEYDPQCLVVHRGTPQQRPGWRRVFFPTRNTLWLIRTYYPQPQAAYMIFSRAIIGLVRAISFHELTHYFKALHVGLTAPVKKNILPASLRSRFTPFWQQNSVFHHIFRMLSG